MKNKNIRRPTALAISFWTVVLFGQTALADSLAVKVRQIDTANAQTVTCAAEKKCTLPLDIRSKTKNENVTVGISFVPPRNILFTFETPEGFLYAGQKNPADKQHAMYQTVWTEAALGDKPTTTAVTLFEPRVPSPIVAPILNTPQAPVADLEITVEATP